MVSPPVTQSSTDVGFSSSNVMENDDIVPGSEGEDSPESLHTESPLLSRCDQLADGAGDQSEWVMAIVMPTVDHFLVLYNRLFSAELRQRRSVGQTRDNEK